MDHSTRYQLAHDLCARAATSYGGSLLAAGVFGSTARNEDTEYSDLDLLFISRDGATIPARTFLFQGIAVVCNTITEQELMQHLSEPTLKWPYWMGLLDQLQVLAGDSERARGWLEHGRNLPPERLHLALSIHLAELVFESYGRVRSCVARGNQRDIGHAAIEVMYEINTALCMLNSRWVTRDYYGAFEQAFAFPLLPQGYHQLIPSLWTARELDETATLCGALVNAYWRLLTSQGMNITNYQKLEELP